MEIVKLIVYKTFFNNDKYTLYFRRNDNINILQFCEDNDIKEFDICEGERMNRYGYGLFQHANFLGARTDYYIDFYRKNGVDAPQDEIFSFWLYSSNPLDYENFCNDNGFYKFQIRSKSGKSPFYYCGKVVQKSPVKNQESEQILMIALEDIKREKVKELKK